MSRSTLTLFSCMTIMAMLGSFYGFSLLMAPWEQMLGATRAEVSSIMSVAMVSATAGIFIGHRLYPLVSPPVFAAAVCSVSATGLAIAGWGTSLLPLWLGFGLLFGGANGIGYGFSIQMVTQELPDRKGFAIGVTAASYAVGMGLAPPFVNMALNAGGISAAMNGLALAFVAVGLLTAGMLKVSRASLETEPRVLDPDAKTGPHSTEVVLWLGYGAGAAAGVMAIAHSAGIVTAAGGSEAFVVAGPVINAVGYLSGCLVAGWLADRISIRTLLSILPLLSAGILLMLAYGGSPIFVLGCLGLIGFSYGALVAAYPAAVAHYFGVLATGRIYGRICISWGAAGFLAPWFAGYLFDQSGGYNTALMVAAGTAVASALAVRLLPPRSNVDAVTPVSEDASEKI